MTVRVSRRGPWPRAGRAGLGGLGSGRAGGRGPGGGARLRSRRVWVGAPGRGRVGPGEASDHGCLEERAATVLRAVDAWLPCRASQGFQLSAYGHVHGRRAQFLTPNKMNIHINSIIHININIIILILI